MQEPTKPTLYLMIGYPGSGKSSFAGKLAAKIGGVRFNTDAMRIAMFGDPTNHHNARSNKIIVGGLSYVAAECLGGGISVIFDSNANQYRYREKKYQAANALGANHALIWIKTPLKVAIQRAATREISKYNDNMDEALVRQVASGLEEPKADENVIIIDGTISFDDQFQQFLDQAP